MVAGFLNSDPGRIRCRIPTPVGLGLPTTPQNRSESPIQAFRPGRMLSPGPNPVYPAHRPPVDNCGILAGWNLTITYGLGPAASSLCGRKATEPEPRRTRREKSCGPIRLIGWSGFAPSVRGPHRQGGGRSGRPSSPRWPRCSRPIRWLSARPCGWPAAKGDGDGWPFAVRSSQYMAVCYDPDS